MALTFNASLSQSLNHGAAVIGSQYPCSMACWVNMPADTTVEMSAWTIGHPTVDSALILGANPFGTTNGLLYSQLSQSGGTPVQANGPLPTVAAWYHIAVVVLNQFHIILYVNGVPTLSGPGGPSQLFDVSDTRIGALLQGGTVTHFFTGTIAYPAAWNSGLSAADIANLYNGGAGGDPRFTQSGSLVSFSLLQGSAPYFDSGTQSNWTVNGSPTSATDPFVLNVVPSVVALPATNIESTSVTLNGQITTLNAGPNVTQYGFFYGTTTAYGKTFSSTVGSYGPMTFTTNVTGLIQGTLYHFQAWVQAPGGLAVSSDATFSNQPGFTRGEVLYNGPQIITGQVSAGNPINLLDANDLTTFTTVSSGSVGVDCGIGTQLTRFIYGAVGAKEDLMLNDVIQGSKSDAKFGTPVALTTISTRALVGTLSNEIDLSIAPQFYRYYRVVSSGKALGYGDIDWIGFWTLGTLSQPVQPVATPPGGNFDMPTVVRLGSISTASSIYYTTDGSVPTTASTLYAGPIIIGTNTTLNAIAVDSLQSTPISRMSSYVFLVPSIFYAQEFIRDNRNIQMLTDSGHLLLDPVSRYYFYYLSCREMNALAGGAEPHFFQGASVYRSVDLRNWTFMGQVMGAPPGLQVNYATTNSIRVQVYYCAATQMYVGWSSNPNLNVWTSPFPDATVPWTFVTAYTQTNVPGDGIAATGHNDIGSFTDPVSGNAYLIYNYNNNTRTSFSLLDPASYTNTLASGSANYGILGEAHTLTYRNGTYFYMGSGTTGFAYNANYYLTSSTPIGPWSGTQKNPFQTVAGSIGDPATSYNSQCDQILAIPGRGPNCYIYIGDNYETPGATWFEYLSKKVMIPMVFPTTSTFTITWLPGNWVDGTACSPWQLDSVFPTVSGAPAAASGLAVTTGFSGGSWKTNATWANNEIFPTMIYLDNGFEPLFITVNSEVLPAGTTNWMVDTSAQPFSYFRVRTVNINGTSVSGTVNTFTTPTAGQPVITPVTPLGNLKFPLTGPNIGTSLTLGKASLLDYCNPAVKNDQAFVAICKALDPQLQRFVQEITNCIMLSNLGNQPEEILDFLAIYHFNVDYYDTTLPLATKLLLVQNVINDKISKGTPSRITTLINQVFAFGELVEWFNDTPVAEANTFRIQIADPLTNPTDVANLVRAILIAKNVRSYFAGISSFESAFFKNFVTTGMAEYDYQVITIA